MSERQRDVATLVVDRLADSYRLARAILLDDGEAEDAVQEASLAAWRRRDSIRDTGRFEVWFERILVNQCRDQLRRRKRSVQLASPPIGFDPPGAAQETGTDPALDRALATLDADHRSSWSCATGRTERLKTSPNGWASRQAPSNPGCTTR